MTDPLYLDSTMDRRFDAEITRVVGNKVVLDRTKFYPTGGGQPNDTGILSANGETWNVSDVTKKDTIYHTIAGEPPAEGTTVTGELNWDRRSAHMRYHTAQHLLAAVLLDDYDAPTTGNQLYDDRARIDCGYDRFTDTDFEDIEVRMNGLIDDSIPVEWYTMDREIAEAELDPKRTRIHLLPESITEIRIVEIEGVDRTACAGTHVANTEEIGRFSITGRETKGSDEERLKFVLDK